MTLKNISFRKVLVFMEKPTLKQVSNLISYHLKKEEDPFTAFKNAISQLEGSWGLVVIIKDKPNSLFISKSGSPLLTG